MGRFWKTKVCSRNQDIPVHLNFRVYNMSILPVATYGVETMSITNGSANRLKPKPRKIERSTLRISIRNRIRNEKIKRQRQIKGVTWPRQSGDGREMLQDRNIIDEAAE